MSKIEINSNILSGKPVIRGTSIPVYLIMNLLNNDYTIDKILETYPNLKREDVESIANLREHVKKGVLGIVNKQKNKNDILIDSRIINCTLEELFSKMFGEFV